METNLVIHARSVGLYPNVHEVREIDMDTLLPHIVVADGKYWTGNDTDVSVMRKALLDLDQ